MKEHLKEVLSKQRYDQLSIEEIESLNDLCKDENNSEVIGSIFNVLDGLNANATIQPRNQTKERLNNLFQTSSRARGSSFSMDALVAIFFPPTKLVWQKRLIPLAAVVVLLFISVWFWTDDIKVVNGIGMKTAQLRDRDVKRTTKIKNQTKDYKSTDKKQVNSTENKTNKTTSLTNTLFADDLREDAYTTVGSYASGDLDGSTLTAAESVADNMESVSFRLADCPECMELITASY